MIAKNVHQACTDKRRKKNPGGEISKFLWIEPLFPRALSGQPHPKQHPGGYKKTPGLNRANRWRFKVGYDGDDTKLPANLIALC